MLIRKLRSVISLIMVLLVLLIGCSVQDESSAYSRAKEQGYTGTAEQFAAALVGECVENPGATAYDLAKENGFTGTAEDWMEILTGVSIFDPNKSAYAMEVDRGYGGSLAQWVSEKVPAPESLGHSQEGDTPTEYELACFYGFEGTFVEWLVSLVQT